MERKRSHEELEDIMRSIGFNKPVSVKCAVEITHRLLSAEKVNENEKLQDHIKHRLVSSMIGNIAPSKMRVDIKDKDSTFTREYVGKLFIFTPEEVLDLIDCALRAHQMRGILDQIDNTNQ